MGNTLLPAPAAADRDRDAERSSSAAPFAGYARWGRVIPAGAGAPSTCGAGAGGAGGAGADKHGGSASRVPEGSSRAPPGANDANCSGGTCSSIVSVDSFVDSLGGSCASSLATAGNDACAATAGVSAVAHRIRCGCGGGGAESFLKVWAVDDGDGCVGPVFVPSSWCPRRGRPLTVLRGLRLEERRCYILFVVYAVCLRCSCNPWAAPAAGDAGGAGGGGGGGGGGFLGVSVSGAAGGAVAAAHLGFTTPAVVGGGGGRHRRPGGGRGGRGASDGVAGGVGGLEAEVAAGDSGCAGAGRAAGFAASLRPPRLVYEIHVWEGKAAQPLSRAACAAAAAQLAKALRRTCGSVITAPGIDAAIAAAPALAAAASRPWGGAAAAGGAGGALRAPAPSWTNSGSSASSFRTVGLAVSAPSEAKPPTTLVPPAVCLASHPAPPPAAAPAAAASRPPPAGPAGSRPPSASRPPPSGGGAGASVKMLVGSAAAPVGAAAPAGAAAAARGPQAGKPAPATAAAGTTTSAQKGSAAVKAISAVKGGKAAQEAWRMAPPPKGSSPAPEAPAASLPGAAPSPAPSRAPVPPLKTPRAIAAKVLAGQPNAPVPKLSRSRLALVTPRTLASAIAECSETVHALGVSPRGVGSLLRGRGPGGEVSPGRREKQRSRSRSGDRVGGGAGAGGGKGAFATVSVSDAVSRKGGTVAAASGGAGDGGGAAADAPESSNSDARESRVRKKGHTGPPATGADGALVSTGPGFKIPLLRVEYCAAGAPGRASGGEGQPPKRRTHPPAPALPPPAKAPAAPEVPKRASGAAGGDRGAAELPPAALPPALPADPSDPSSPGRARSQVTVAPVRAGAAHLPLAHVAAPPRSGLGPSSTVASAAPAAAAPAAPAAAAALAGPPPSALAVSDGAIRAALAAAALAESEGSSPGWSPPPAPAAAGRGGGGGGAGGDDDSASRATPGRFSGVCSEIAPGSRLFVSGAAAAADEGLLGALGISHIVNVAASESLTGPPLAAGQGGGGAGGGAGNFFGGAGSLSTPLAGGSAGGGGADCGGDGSAGGGGGTAGGGAPAFGGGAGRTYLGLSLQDNRYASEQIRAVLCDLLEYIHAALSADPRARVLVHCREGISRSPTVVLAYAMWRARAPFAAALAALRRVRPLCNPNTGFTFALLRLQKALAAKLAAEPAAAESVGAESAAAERAAQAPPAAERAEQPRPAALPPVAAERAVDSAERAAPPPLPPLPPAAPPAAPPPPATPASFSPETPPSAGSPRKRQRRDGCCDGAARLGSVLRFFPAPPLRHERASGGGGAGAESSGEGAEWRAETLRAFWPGRATAPAAAPEAAPSPAAASPSSTESPAHPAQFPPPLGAELVPRGLPAVPSPREQSLPAMKSPSTPAPAPEPTSSPASPSPALSPAERRLFLITLHDAAAPFIVAEGISFFQGGCWLPPLGPLDRRFCYALRAGEEVFFWRGGRAGAMPAAFLLRCLAAGFLRQICRFERRRREDLRVHVVRERGGGARTKGASDQPPSPPSPPSPLSPPSARSRSGAVGEGQKEAEIDGKAAAGASAAGGTSAAAEASAAAAADIPTAAEASAAAAVFYSLLSDSDRPPPPIVDARADYTPAYDRLASAPVLMNFAEYVRVCEEGCGTLGRPVAAGTVRGGFGGAGSAASSSLSSCMSDEAYNDGSDFGGRPGRSRVRSPRASPERPRAPAFKLRLPPVARGPPLAAPAAATASALEPGCMSAVRLEPGVPYLYELGLGFLAAGAGASGGGAGAMGAGPDEAPSSCLPDPATAPWASPPPTDLFEGGDLQSDRVYLIVRYSGEALRNMARKAAAGGDEGAAGGGEGAAAAGGGEASESSRAASSRGRTPRSEDAAGACVWIWVGAASLADDDAIAGVVEKFKSVHGMGRGEAPAVVCWEREGCESQELEEILWLT